MDAPGTDVIAGKHQVIVGIHQPNYAPWCGYFHKMARSDIFVFLDDAQFTKNSYVNRVKILENGKDVWLTIPAKPPLGTPIRKVVCRTPDWPDRHLDRLRNAYRSAPAFRSVWPDVEQMYKSLLSLGFAEANRTLIATLARRLSISTDIRVASDIPNEKSLRSDDRLIDIIRRVDGDGYLSGKGGQSYQDPAKFSKAGIELEITRFVHSEYQQQAAEFHPGLSVLDAAFHLGWDGAADVVHSEGPDS